MAYSQVNSDYDDLENKKGDAERCIGVAQEAFLNKKYERVVRFLEKAERIYPTERAKELLKQVHNITSDNTNNHSCENSKDDSKSEQFQIKNDFDKDKFEKYIDDAQEALNALKFKNVKENLEKAIYLCSTELDNYMSKQGKNLQVIIDDDKNKDEVEKCIQIAKKALYTCNFKKAERFLKKALNFCPLEFNTVSKQKQTNNIRFNRNENNESYIELNYNTRKIHQDEDFSNEKEQAEQSIGIAINALFKNDCKKVERFLKKAARFCGTNSTILDKDFLGEIHTAFINESTDISSDKKYEDVSKQEEMYEVNFDNNVNKVEKCINIAHEALNTQNLMKAEQFFTIALHFSLRESKNNWQKEIHNTSYYENINNKSDKNASNKSEQRQYYQEQIFGSNKEVNKLKNLEKTFFHNKYKFNFIKNNNLGQSTDMENKIIAEKCINIAKEALSKKNYKKTKRMLEKAERFWSTELSTEIFKQIPENFLYENNKNVNNKYSKDTIDQNNYARNNKSTEQYNEKTKKDAQQYIEKAIKAMSDKNYKIAQSLLEEAESLFPTEIAKHLLKQIFTVTNENNEGYSGQYSNNSLEQNVDIVNKKKDAELCILVAKKALSEKNYKKAQSLLEKAERLCPTETAKDLLRQVPRTNNCNENNDNNKKTAEQYIESAKKAQVDKNYEKAYRLLQKAEHLYPTENAKKLLKQISYHIHNEKNETKISKNISENNSKQNLNIDNKREADEIEKNVLLALKNKLFVKARRLTKTAKKIMGKKAEVLLQQVDEEEEKSRRLATPEQLEAIRIVNSKNEIHEILGLPKDATAVMIRKRCNALKVLLHTDKNPAPGAEEAFMKIMQISKAQKMKKC